MKTTIYTQWGRDTIAVSADWSQASCAVEGDAHGRQVADFRHNPTEALRVAVMDAAMVDGLSESDADHLSEVAVLKAVHADTYLPHLHNSP